MLLLLCFSNISLAQSSTLTKDDCNSVTVKNETESKYPSIYILEKENEQGNWESITKLKTKDAYLNFKVKENGKYLVTIKSSTQDINHTNTVEIHCHDKKHNHDNLELYPNPASNFVHLLTSAEIGRASTYIITASDGKVVTTGLITKQKTIIPLNKLTPGIYSVGILVEDKLIQNSKLIVNP